MRIRTIIFAALVGVATTIVTAWAFQIQLALWRWSSPERLAQFHNPAWASGVPDGWPIAPDRGFAGSSFGVTFTLLASHEPNPRWPQETPLHQYVSEFGFPMRALSSEIKRDRSNPVDPSWREGFRLGMPEPMDGPFYCASLPLIPCWPGFLVNTAIFGALAAAWPAFKESRLCRRRRRGECTACAYPISDDHHACPECGLQRMKVNRPQ